MATSIERVGISVVSSSLNDDGLKTSHIALLLVESVALGGLHEVEAVLDGDAESLIVHRDADGQVRAWLNVCPHAGRRLDWAPGEFLRSKEGLMVCAVHGASFELATGGCVAGPCRGEHLRQIDVHCADGEVRLGAAPEGSSSKVAS